MKTFEELRSEYAFSNNIDVKTEMKKYWGRDPDKDEIFRCGLWMGFDAGFIEAQRWIPLTEEKPPYYKPVLVKYKSKTRNCEDVACCWLSVCDNGSYEWTINGTDHLLFSNSVIAWRLINIE